MVHLRTYFLIKLMTLWNTVCAWNVRGWYDRVCDLFSPHAWLLLPGHTFPLSLHHLPRDQRSDLSHLPVQWIYQSSRLVFMGSDACRDTKKAYRLSWLSVKLILTEPQGSSRTYNMDPFLEGLVIETSSTFPTLHDLYLVWCASVSTWSSSDIQVQFQIINHLGEDQTHRMDEPHTFVTRGSLLDLEKID
jgi:hypothetical protein